VNDKQARVAAIKESLAQNKAALNQYSWIETTQVSMKGEAKKNEVGIEQPGRLDPSVLGEGTL
jgi:hypothetical protein